MKIDTLTKKVDALVVSKSINVVNPFHVDCCSICASPMHLAQTCPSLSAFVESPMEQVNAFNDFRNPMDPFLRREMLSHLQPLPLLRFLLGLLHLRPHTLIDCLRPRKKESLRTFWRYSSTCKSTSPFWMPSNSCRLMPRS